MFDIVEIESAEEKAALCERILRALPEWFGSEEGIAENTGKARKARVYAAVQGSEAVGFVSLIAHNRHTAEIATIGIVKTRHRQGIGTALIGRCERLCTENGMEFLTVKTLDESAESDGYARTRAFYHAMGFRPLEVFPLYWDADNPCVFLAKHLPCAAREEAGCI